MPISCAAASEGASVAAKTTVPKVRCFIESFPFSGRKTLTPEITRDNGLDISPLRTYSERHKSIGGDQNQVMMATCQIQASSRLKSQRDTTCASGEMGLRSLPPRGRENGETYSKCLADSFFSRATFSSP